MMSTGLRNILKKTPPVGLVAVAIAVFLTSFPRPAFPEHNQAVARVNGIPIYQSDLNCALEAALIRPGPADGRNTDPDERALQRLVNIELLYQEGLKLRFPGIDSEVERRYATELHRLGGPKGMAVALECIEMTTDDLKKKIFRNLTINGYLGRRVYSRVQISDDEVLDYFTANPQRFRRPETVRIRQILIRVKTWDNPEAIQEAHTRARTVYGAAVKGSDFMLLARKYSEDPSGGSAGGDMGTIARGNLQTHIDSIIFSLPPGGISKPVRSRRGYHIFKVVNVTPPSTRPLEEVHDRITASLRHRKAKAMINDLLKKLRGKATIEILK